MFKQVLSSSKNKGIWSPTRIGDTLIGYLVKVEKNQGPRRNSTLYTIRTNTNNIVQLWGSFVLDDLMSLVSVGSLVKIVYKGTAISKTGAEYKKWEVYVDVDDSTEVNNSNDTNAVFEEVNLEELEKN